MARADFNFNFTPHPLTKDLVVVKGSNAIKQSLKHIVLSSFYSREYEPDFGSGVSASMFELFTPANIQTLKDVVALAIKNHEPDVEVIRIDVFYDGANELIISIYYNELNNADEQYVSVQLSRDIR